MAAWRRRYRLLAELFRRIWRFLAVFASVYLVTGLGFYLLQPGQTPLAVFYWAIVTLSTTGYGDITPTTTFARLFTIGVLFTQIFLLGFLISTITAVMNDEAQRRALGTLGTDFRDHTVVLGYGAVGRAAVRELLAAEQKVAVVTAHAEEVANLRATAPESSLFVTYGSASDPTILERVNLAQAHSVIVCTDDDTQTLIASITIRATVPKIRIVVSVNRPELKDTLRSAGVTYVASPGDMGGRLCSSAAFEPDVADAVEDLTAAAEGADIQEYLVTDRAPIARRGLRDAEAAVRAASDCLVLGYARRGPGGEYRTQLNPPAAHVFAPGDAVIVMGSLENLKRFHRWFGEPQGR